MITWFKNLRKKCFGCSTRSAEFNGESHYVFQHNVIAGGDVVGGNLYKVDHNTNTATKVDTKVVPRSDYQSTSSALTKTAEDMTTLAFMYSAVSNSNSSSSSSDSGSSYSSSDSYSSSSYGD